MATPSTTDDLRELTCFFFAGGGEKCTPKASDLQSQRTRIERLIARGHGRTVLQSVKNINGRCCKQYTLLFAIAVCTRSNDPNIAKEAYVCLRDICKIPTDLFMFVKFSKELFEEGNHKLPMGRLHRREIAKWYTENPRFQEDIMLLALYVTKYPQRHGVSHRYILKRVHPKPPNAAFNFIFRYVIRGLQYAKRKYSEDQEDPDLQCTNQVINYNIVLVKEFLEDLQKLRLSRRGQEEEACDILKKRQDLLTWEHVPYHFLKNEQVWHILIKTLPMTALIRKLSRLSSLGILQNETEKWVCGRLENVEILNMSRLHPIQILVAISQYRHGVPRRGHKITATQSHWSPSEKILKSLEIAFFSTFGNVRPTGKCLLLAINISSMDQPCLGTTSLKTRDIAAAAALLYSRTENDVTIITISKEVSPFVIGERDDIESVLQKISQVPGDTELHLPFKYALDQRMKVDAVILVTDIVITDGESTCNSVRREFEFYQQHVNGQSTAKLVFVNLCNMDNTVAADDNPDMLHVNGMDSCTFEIISNFISPLDDCREEEMMDIVEERQ